MQNNPTAPRADLADYYRQRAREYDKLYERADRQVALSESSAILEEIFAGKTVLEIACGTGYWTEHIAETATSVLATDINREMLAIAEVRSYPRHNVSFQLADIYTYSPSQESDALFGGFIWSHIPVSELQGFLARVNSFLSPGGTVVFIDNRYVKGSSTPIAERDTDGNTYQDRPLADGSIHRIVKNFPSAEFLKSAVSEFADTVQVMELEYYWIMQYTLK
jgi:demethylmenaquinone methyltransferase/2-methoxy-6-polyprenyl-1,4-benzoquinol methylase